MSAITTIPTTTDVAVPPTGSTAIKKYSITEADVAAIEAKRGLKVLDIHDKKQVEAVEQLHREAKKGRTTVDRERLEANKELKRTIEESVEWNNNAAAALQSRLNPIENEANAEIERVEALIEAERVAAKNKLLNDRKTAMAEVVGEFKDILAAYPDDYLSSVSASVFDPLLMTLRVQVEGRKQLVEQQRIAKQQADKALEEQQERDRLAEVERLKQQAIEDQKRKADQEALDAKMAAFEKQQAEVAELQRKADADRDARIAQENADRMEREAVQRAADQAKLDAQTAELNRQLNEIAAERWKYEEEMTRLAREADERVRLRLEADAKAKEAERQKEQQRLFDERVEEDRKLLEAMRPDKENLSLLIERLRERVTEETWPTMTTEIGQELLCEMMNKLMETLDELGEMLT